MSIMSLETIPAEYRKKLPAINQIKGTTGDQPAWTSRNPTRMLEMAVGAAEIRINLSQGTNRELGRGANVSVEDMVIHRLST